MSSTVEQIKERIGIAEVVSSYVKLEKAGKTFKARCPFHTEKTPSFFVSPDRETYHCFGCGKGGDIFSFVEEIEGLDFSGALKVLAERTGVSIPRFNSKAEDTKKHLYSILEEATNFFESQLFAHKKAGEYLKARGLTGKTAKSWRIGYALPEWRSLYTFLKNRHFTDKEMADTGLTNTSGDKVYDRFRGRIMFPIMDASGRVVAFSGRIFNETEDDKAGAAKYINSPETSLYDKSKILYGFDKAKMAIRKEDSCIVVEGQVDVILSHQAGFQNTVAASGTAFTEGHLSLIGRMTKNIILAFDGDEAGFKAMRRGVELALFSGFAVRVAHLEEGRDPADIIQKDETDWKRYILESKHIVEFYLDMLSQKYSNERELRLKIEEFVVPFIARIKSPIEQAHFVKLTAERINMGEDPVWRSIKNYEHTKPALQEKKSGVQEKESALIIKNPEEIRFLNIEHHLCSIFLWQKKEKNPSLDLKDFANKYEDIVGKRFTDTINTIDEKERERLIFEAEAAHQNAKDIKRTVEELFNNLLKQTLKIKLIEAMDAVKVAEQKGDETEAKKALSLCHTLSKKINEVPV
ncbi:MAG: DNA primase [Parcubacteria group bacterium]|nr:DNA primase [Parcubacteria group bacterium]